MYDITANLTIKNKTCSAELTYYYVNGIKKTNWVSKGAPKNKNKKKNEKKLIKIRDEFINELEIITQNKVEKGKENKKAQISFADFMVDWLNMIKYQIEESTYTGYKRQIEGRTKEYFTKNPVTLADLKPVNILDFYNWLYSQGLKGNTVIKYHANIRKALNYAVQADLIPANPCAKVGIPHQEQFIADYYNEEELNNLFKAIKGSTLELIIYLTAFYGLRRSEVLGIRWSAIDFENKTITINHKVVTVINENKDIHRKTILIAKSKTKNKSSYRTLPLLREIEELLLYTKRMQQYYKTILGNNYNYKYVDYVCLDEYGNLRKPDYVSHKFRQLLKKNKLREIRFHDLRHSCRYFACKKGNFFKRDSRLAWSF